MKQSKGAPMNTTLFQDLMNLAQRIRSLADELIGAAGQFIDLIKRYDDQMDSLGQTEGRELCRVCGAALNEDGTCPKTHHISAAGWLE